MTRPWANFIMQWNPNYNNLNFVRDVGGDEEENWAVVAKK